MPGTPIRGSIIWKLRGKLKANSQFIDLQSRPRSAGNLLKPGKPPFILDVPLNTKFPTVIHPLRVSLTSDFVTQIPATIPRGVLIWPLRNKLMQPRLKMTQGPPKPVLPFPLSMKTRPSVVHPLKIQTLPSVYIGVAPLQPLSVLIWNLRGKLPQAKFLGSQVAVPKLPVLPLPLRGSKSRPKVVHPVILNKITAVDFNMIGTATLVLTTSALPTADAALISSISLVLATTSLLKVDMDMSGSAELVISTSADMTPIANLGSSITLVLTTSGTGSRTKMKGMSRNWVDPPARITHTQFPYVTKKQSGDQEPL